MFVVLFGFSYCLPLSLGGCVRMSRLKKLWLR